MGQLLTGIAMLIFGLTVGGVGVASAGIGIGIPMIPLGAYIACRGWRIYNHDKQEEEGTNTAPLKPFERTRVGQLCLGFILILIGAGTSAALIGLPILAFGMFLIYCGIFSKQISDFIGKA